MAIIRLMVSLAVCFLLVSAKDTMKEAGAQSASIVLKQVQYSGGNRNVNEFVLMTNRVLALCHRTGKLDASLANRLESSSASISRSVVQAGGEDQDMPPIRHAIKQLWLARLKCV